MYHVTVYRLVILPIDENVIIRDLGQTVLGPQIFGSLVKVVLAQFGHGTFLLPKVLVCVESFWMELHPILNLRTVEVDLFSAHSHFTYGIIYL